MDTSEIQQVKRQIENARSNPEKAIALLIDVIERIVDYLILEKDGRLVLNKNMEKFNKVMYGYYDEESRRHEGFIDTVTEMKKSSDAARAQSKVNASRLNKLIFTIIGALAVQVILHFVKI